MPSPSAAPSELRAALEGVDSADAAVVIAWWQDRAKRLRALADTIGVRLGSGNYLDDASKLDDFCVENGFILADAPKDGIG